LSIPPITLKKIAAIIPRLGSDHDGEALAAARAIGRTLATAHCGFTDLAEVLAPAARPAVAARHASQPKPWKHVAMWCAQYGANILSEREMEFVDSLLRSTSFRTLSPRQLAWLEAIQSKLSMRGAA